jgi:hypothetical protein
MKMYFTKDDVNIPMLFAGMTKEQLEQQMEAAIRDERFMDAAELRDIIIKMERDPEFTTDLPLLGGGSNAYNADHVLGDDVRNTTGNSFNFNIDGGAAL